MGGKLLEIDGTSIKFICEVKKQSTSSVRLTNISDDYVAFKVKTTSPKRFCVRPNSGIISPKSAYDFSVTMQGLRSAPSEVECKDKFLIQSTVVDSGLKEEDVTLELFSKSSGKYVEEKKLRVVLVSKQDSPTAEHKSKELAKEPSNETSVKQENVVKKDENVPPVENKVEDPVEVKAAFTTEDPKPSHDSGGNERDLSKNLKFNPVKVVKEDPERKPSRDSVGNERDLSKNLKFHPVKVVKEDPERKLRLSKQLKDLKVKETTLENQLKEAKSTISSITYQNSIIIEAKETLQLELDRRSKRGFSLAIVCMVSLIGLISGYISDP